MRTCQIVLLIVLAGCSGGSDALPDGAAAVPALVGADVSALERLEQAGGIFKDGGTAGNAIAILRSHGSNIIRLRLFANPSGQNVQVNDLAYTIRMAVRAKTAGAKLLLDLHYSDTWADPCHQDTPAAWAGLPFDTLEARVEAYSAGVITQLKQAGALPSSPPPRSSLRPRPGRDPVAAAHPVPGTRIPS